MIALSGKVVIRMTDYPNEPSLSGAQFSFAKPRKQLEHLMELAELVYTDAMNAGVHTKLLMEELEELGR